MEQEEVFEIHFGKNILSVPYISALFKPDHDRRLFADYLSNLKISMCYSFVTVGYHLLSIWRKAGHTISLIIILMPFFLTTFLLFKLMHFKLKC